MQAATQKRRLGRTDLEVTLLGLGGNKFSGGQGLTGLVFPEIPQPEVDAIVQAALDGGANWVDTAEVYGGGVMGRACCRIDRHHAAPARLDNISSRG